VAAKNGADCIATTCPLCQMNLEAYQDKINSKFGTDFAMPILFFTQLMGVAFGISHKELGITKAILNPQKALAKV
jgi:heterodisulfide reductase subunit B